MYDHQLIIVFIFDIKHTSNQGQLAESHVDKL
jgi:hypothetical protein